MSQPGGDGYRYYTNMLIKHVRDGKLDVDGYFKEFRSTSGSNFAYNLMDPYFSFRVGIIDKLSGEARGFLYKAIVDEKGPKSMHCYDKRVDRLHEEFVKRVADGREYVL